uniref:Neutral ceramidase n=2 Tax=Arion vulgaris TaxID=1028688 RepID=A0A0B7A399_9EUPU
MADYGRDMHYLLLCLSLLSVYQLCSSANYYVGVGIGDVTGPSADINMMGYANPGQISHGIHMREFSRAFIFANTPTSDRVVFVSIDACWAPGAVKQEVVKQLKALFGNIYTERNVVISGTHTHSGSGGFSQYLLYDITAFGFNHQGYQALVDGVIQSIKQAHSNLKPADIYLNVGQLLDSNINRSPTAYLNNPAAERAQYDYDVDKNITVLKIVDGAGVGMGMISWFAVHCTSMNNTNQLLSSDNKGYASQLFEKEMNGAAHPGQGPFVAAFAQSNLGDVSPNTQGPHCLDSGNPCDRDTSTCHGKNELCVAFGPGKDMFESTEIIGNNQFLKALDLYNSANFKLNGPVDFRHTYVDMPKQNVTLTDGSKVQLCKPAMGYSFAAGTTDGPGAFDFKQGSNSSSPIWNFVRDLIKAPTAQQVKCHSPKPILLDTGEITLPYLWQPQIVDHQILRVGEFVIIAVPGEFSTMAGRRMRNTVYSTLVGKGFSENTTTVIAGLANEYSDYITTFEEYQIQRYEGASTIYGPHTLEAHLQSYTLLSTQMADGQPSPLGPDPPNMIGKQISFVPGVIFDTAPFGKHFGSVLVDAQPSYTQGSTVSVTFVSANPRNNLKTNDTFLTVEHKTNNGSWVVDYTDSYWQTRFYWIRTSTILGESEAKITWDIPADQALGTYRIQHYGTSKSLFGQLTPFVGNSREFSISGSFSRRTAFSVLLM